MNCKKKENPEICAPNLCAQGASHVCVCVRVCISPSVRLSVQASFIVQRVVKVLTQFDLGRIIVNNLCKI